MPCSLCVSGAHPALHSFPTRRSSDLVVEGVTSESIARSVQQEASRWKPAADSWVPVVESWQASAAAQDRKSTRLNSSHVRISYAVFCLKKKNGRYTLDDQERNVKLVS